MPTYDYECKNCNEIFEVFQSINSEPLSVCKKCGGELRRLIGGGAGVIFKGSGFYVNDYKKNSRPVKNDKISNPKSKSNEDCKAGKK